MSCWCTLFGKYVLQAAAVEVELAGAGHQAHPHHGLLAAADGLDGAVEQDRLARRGLGGGLDVDDLGDLGGLGRLGASGLGHLDLGRVFGRLGHCATCLISNGIGCCAACGCSGPA